MNITWLGQSAFKIEAKSDKGPVTIVTDPFDPAKTGLKLPRSIKSHVVTASTKDAKPKNVAGAETKQPFTIQYPGEFDVRGVVIYGIPLKENIAYFFEVEGLTVVHLGRAVEKLSAAQLEKIEGADILMLPVGGNGLLDKKSATEVVSQIEPRIVIPMLYKVKGVKEKLDELDAFCKEMGTNCKERLDKFKIVKKDLPQEDMKVVVLENQ